MKVTENDTREVTHVSTKSLMKRVLFYVKRENHDLESNVTHTRCPYHTNTHTLYSCLIFARYGLCICSYSKIRFHVQFS